VAMIVSDYFVIFQIPAFDLPIFSTGK